MKRLTYLICFAPLLMTMACTKHRNCCVMPQPSTEVTAQKNGVKWSPILSQGTISEADSLSISATEATHDGAVFNKIDTLNIKIRYNTPGTYILQGNDAFYGVFKNGAVTSYKLDGSSTNAIVITGHERISNPGSSVPDQVKISGTFSLKFVDPNNPAGIVFQNGSFYTYVPYL